MQRVFAIMLAAAVIIAVLVTGYMLVYQTLASSSLSTASKTDILSTYSSTGRIIALTLVFTTIAIMITLLAKQIIKTTNKL